MKNFNRKIIQKLLWLALIIAFSTNVYAAQDFMIENRTNLLLVVNGSSGNILLKHILI